jgi:hypothetical protein
MALRLGFCVWGFETGDVAAAFSIALSASSNAKLFLIFRAD